MPFVSDRRLWITSDGDVVEETDHRAAFLLVGVGGALDDVTARKYGLIQSSAQLASSAPVPEDAGADALIEGKAEELLGHKAVEPQENKQIFPAANPRAKKGRGTTK